MIPEAEIRRLAGRDGIDPMVMDLDYVLGCFLAALYRAEAPLLRFKGGTCLRKCYYGDYRFSEDLDFTTERRLSPGDVERLLKDVATTVDDLWQVDFAVRPIRLEVVDDEYGKESYQARLYYRGPLRRGGDPRAIRVDVTTHEVLGLPSAHRQLTHPYSDADSFGDITIPCYDLLEVLAEKTRAMAGQRKYAISRDLYDIAQLTLRQPVDPAALAKVLPGKLAVKGLAETALEVDRVLHRRADFRADWDRNLMHLLPPGAQEPFEDAWTQVIDFLVAVDKALRG